MDAEFHCWTFEHDILLSGGSATGNPCAVCCDVAGDPHEGRRPTSARRKAPAPIVPSGAGAPHFSTRSPVVKTEEL